jgi:hypothetical protein
MANALNRVDGLQGADMRTIAIGLLAVALASGTATAQTAGEQARIIGEFEHSVAAYVDGETAAPKIFTLPVAMVFRQVIARALAERDGVAAINGVGAYAHVRAMDAFPSNQLHEFPRVLSDALPPLPPPLEYRLVGHDLVVRDKEANVVVGMMREAVGPALTVIR